MSLPSSLSSAQQPHKQSTNIYTVMLIVSLLAIITDTVILAMELNRFGEYPWWEVPAGGSAPAGT